MSIRGKAYIAGIFEHPTRKAVEPTFRDSEDGQKVPVFRPAG